MTAPSIDFARRMSNVDLPPHPLSLAVPTAPSTREEIAREVASMEREWAEGDPSDPELREGCGRRLSSLRALFREAPGLFDGETVAALRTISEALRAPIPRRA